MWLAIRAELWAVKIGLELAGDKGVKLVVLEVDSATVAGWLMKKSMGTVINRPLLSQIRELLSHGR